MVLEERGRKVLEAVVASYIETGEPIGSRTITKKFGFGLSPATIRNIMADLEDMRLLTHPHTSAGRIPTDLGYRYYVDILLETASGEEMEREVRERLHLPEPNARGLLTEISRVLSSVSHYAGIVMAADLPDALIRRVQFIRLRHDKALAILVTAAGMVQNKVVEVSETLSQKDLDHLASRMNSLLEEMGLQDVREMLRREVEGARDRFSRMMEQLTSPGDRAGSGRGDDLFVGGVSEIMGQPEFANNLDKLRNLYRTFEDKYHLMNLLDRSIDAEGVQIFIGSENPYFEMQDCSVVTASYKSQGRVAGVLGVIGPTRMDYNRVISVVNCTAKLLGKVMDQENDAAMR